MNYTIAIDQSTSATKALLFDEQSKLVASASVVHQQYYPQPGWVEHDAEEIYQNTVKAIREVVDKLSLNPQPSALNPQPSAFSPQPSAFSLAITNQRETVVIWNRTTGKPISKAVVWQCMRGADICNQLKADGYSPMVKEKSGLLIDPYFAGSGAKWLLDNIPGAREEAEKGNLCFGTIDSWLIYKLTEGRCHLTDYTNASRTLLFNIHTLD